MLSKKTVEELKKNWYSFEEIEWIKLWLKQSDSWLTISKEEINTFVKNDLFSKYTTNV
jgi:hypothetical protein